MFRTFWTLLAVMGLLLPVAAAGQTGTSTIGGLVRDESGGAIPGVSIRIVNEETGVAIDTVTNEEGLYRATALVPGTLPRRNDARRLRAVDPAQRHPPGQPDALPST